VVLVSGIFLAEGSSTVDAIGTKEMCSVSVSRSKLVFFLVVG